MYVNAIIESNKKISSEVLQNIIIIIICKLLYVLLFFKKSVKLWQLYIIWNLKNQESLCP